MDKKLQVLVAASEARPLAQTGGLADVAGSLPQALARQGAGAAVILPAYQCILENKAFKFTQVGGEFTVRLGDEAVTGTLLRGELAKNVPAYLIRCDRFFYRPGLYDAGGAEHQDNPERFTFFCLAVLEVLPKLERYPDILLANDWQTGLLMPKLVQLGLNRPRGVFIIHNQGYLGLVPPERRYIMNLPPEYHGIDGLEYFGQSSLLKAGISYGRAVVTVSPSYAQEVQTPEGGHGLDGAMRHHAAKLCGILNGVDYNVWDPANDHHIAAHYRPNNMKGKAKCKTALLKEFGLEGLKDKPVVGMVSRLAGQKGFSLVVEAAEEMFRLGLGLIILGSGEPYYEDMARNMAKTYPGQCAARIGYDEGLSHRILAGADFVLIPSMYEPCGLVQMYGLKYGAVPVVRAVGGLNDTIRDNAGQNAPGVWDTGFKFGQFQARAMVFALKRAVELYSRPEDFKAMQQAGMHEDFSWDASARKYLQLFERVLA